MLEAIRDSLNAIVPHIQKMADNSNPEPYTIESLRLASENLTISIIAAVSGCLGAVFGYLGYRFSKKTAKNVVRVTPDVQRTLCKDFILDMYKNMVYTMIYACSDVKKDNSQLSSLLLPDIDDIFYIEAYNGDPQVYLRMKNLKARKLLYDEKVKWCLNNDTDEKTFADLTLNAMHILVLASRLSTALPGHRTGWQRLWKKSGKNTHEEFNYLLIKHIKNLSLMLQSEKFIETFDSKSSKDMLVKYRKFIESITEMSKLWYALFLQKDKHIWTNPYTDTDPENKEHLNSVLNLKGMLNEEYIRLLKKPEWTGEEAQNLMTEMLAINAVIESHRELNA